MRKIVSLLLVLVVVLGCVGLAACNGGDGGAVVDNGGSEPTNGNGNGDGNGGGESITDILGLGAGITSVRYDMVMTSPGAPTMTIHVWLKENKVRNETEATDGEDAKILIVDFEAGVQYMYMPDMNIAYKMSYDQPTATVITETQTIPDYNPTILGTETMDGKTCLVIGYSDGQETVRIWIWKEHGFPIRSETTTAEGTTVIEFKNIDFGDIPDSMFEIPPDVQIIEV